MPPSPGPVPGERGPDDLARPDTARGVHAVALVRDLQERAARAQPATQEEHHDGCLLRATATDRWWVGAALLHPRGPVPDLPALVLAAERFAARHGVPARVQVCPGCPPGLDALLEGQGYDRSGDVLLLAARTADVPDAALPGSATSVVEGAGGTCRVAVSRDGVPVAAGRVVLERGWAGVFDMATRPAARRRGAAAAALGALARWAEQHGAPRLYLQVERGNAPARGLYAGAGFRELGSYHYRTSARS